MNHYGGYGNNAFYGNGTASYGNGYGNGGFQAPYANGGGCDDAGWWGMGGGSYGTGDGNGCATAWDTQWSGAGGNGAVGGVCSSGKADGKSGKGGCADGGKGE